MNPKDKKDTSSYPFDDYENYANPLAIPSSNDCTGLIQTLPKTEAEAEAYTDVYSIPKQKETEKSNCD